MKAMNPEITMEATAPEISMMSPDTPGRGEPGEPTDMDYTAGNLNAPDSD